MVKNEKQTLKKKKNINKSKKSRVKSDICKKNLEDFILWLKNTTKETLTKSIYEIY